MKKLKSENWRGKQRAKYQQKRGKKKWADSLKQKLQTENGKEEEEVGCKLKTENRGRQRAKYQQKGKERVTAGRDGVTASRWCCWQGVFTVMCLWSRRNYGNRDGATGGAVLLGMERKEWSQLGNWIELDPLLISREKGEKEVG